MWNLSARGGLAEEYVVVVFFPDFSTAPHTFHRYHAPAVSARGISRLLVQVNQEGRGTVEKSGKKTTIAHSWGCFAPIEWLP
jgi:hypothetical protein